MNMAKEKPAKVRPDEKGDKRPGRKSAPVQIERELARMAVVIAAHDEVTISDLLTPIVRQFIVTNYQRVQKEIQVRIERLKKEDKTE